MDIIVLCFLLTSTGPSANHGPLGSWFRILPTEFFLVALETQLGFFPLIRRKWNLPPWFASFQTNLLTAERTVCSSQSPLEKSRWPWQSFTYRLHSYQPPSWARSLLFNQPSVLSTSWRCLLPPTLLPPWLSCSLLASLQPVRQWFWVIFLKVFVAWVILISLHFSSANSLWIDSAT